MYLKNEALVDEVKTVMEEWDWRQNQALRQSAEGSNLFGAF